MRLLADENIPRLVVGFICSRGHDATWVGKVVPGISDREVLSLATTQKRTLITFDTDFGELVFRLGVGAPFGNFTTSARLTVRNRANYSSGSGKPKGLDEPFFRC